MTITDTTLTPGLAGVRARIAEQTREAKRIADDLLGADFIADGSGTNRLRRDGLRHICGLSASTFPPEQQTIEALVKLRLVEPSDPEPGPVRDRYRPTVLGTEVLGLIGVRG